MSGVIGHRRGSDPLLLWCRLAAVVPTQPLAWEPSYAVSTALKKDQKKKKKEMWLIARPASGLIFEQSLGLRQKQVIRSVAKLLQIILPLFGYLINYFLFGPTFTGHFFCARCYVSVGGTLSPPVMSHSSLGSNQKAKRQGYCSVTHLTMVIGTGCIRRRAFLGW